jgi:predicted neuraminidase
VKIGWATALMGALLVVFVFAQGASHFLTDSEEIVERNLNPQELTALHRAHHARRVHTATSPLLSFVEEAVETIEEAVEAVDIIAHHRRQADAGGEGTSGGGQDTGPEGADEEDLDNVVIGQRLPVPEEDEADGESELRRVNEAGGEEPLPEQPPAAQPKLSKEERRVRLDICSRNDSRPSYFKSLSRTPRGKIEQIKSKIRWVSHDGGSIRYSHMSTIARLSGAAQSSDNGWMVVWQTSETIEGVAAQHLAMSTSLDGAKWDKARRLPIRQKAALWSPVLFVPPGSERDEVWLFYTESTNCLRAARKLPSGARIPPRYAPGGDVKLVKSFDGGHSWSLPTLILAQNEGGVVPKVIANQVVVHRATGNWVLPYWREKAPPEACKNSNPPAFAGALVSTDRGRSWRAKGQIRVGGTWLIEGTAVERSDGSIACLFRTSRGKLYQSISYDGGESWTGANPTSVPNPDSKVNAITLTTGELALAFNDSPDNSKINKGRARLRVAVSCDGGQQWVTISELEEGSLRMYIHYPTLVQDGDRLLVVYSVMGHPHLHLGDVGGIKIAEVPLHPPVDKIEELPLEN